MTMNIYSGAPDPYDDVPPIDGPATTARSVKLVAASTIRVRPVRWLWTGRIALGSLCLLGGREGIGKSTLAYTLAAMVTRGELAGVNSGSPRAVIVAATEDSWEHTIVPRLMAAGADLDLIFRVDVFTSENVDTGLSLPRDLRQVERAVREVGAALILLDPLMSRLDASLDTHKDSQVRLALEPLVNLADRTHASVLGLIHVNKSAGADPLTLLMGSRAFAAVARAVLFVMLDPDDEAIRLVGQPKNNLGSTELPTLSFGIESAHVADTDEGEVWTGRLAWRNDRTETIREVLESSGEGLDARSATQEAADWLSDYLESVGGTASSVEIKKVGASAGHSQDTLKRARRVIGAPSSASGFPRQTFWSLPEPEVSRSNSGESSLTTLTAPTAPTGTSVSAVGAVGAVGAGPRGDTSTERDAA